MFNIWTCFSTKKNLMCPYWGSNLDTVKTVYNYRLSRAPRVMESCFGILCVRWRVLLTTIEMSPYNVDIIVLACTGLNNCIMLNDQERWFCSANYLDRELKGGTLYEWRGQLQNNGDRPMRSLQFIFADSLKQQWAWEINWKFDSISVSKDLYTSWYVFPNSTLNLSHFYHCYSIFK